MARNRTYRIIGGVSILLIVVAVIVIFNTQIGSILGLAAQKGADPVLFWSLNQGEGSTANDTTSNQNNGTITGAVWEDEVDCKFQSCLTFDGSGDHIRKTYSSDTELNPGTGSFAVSIWFRHSTTAPTGNEALIMRYVDAGYAVYMTTTGTLCFAIDDDSTWDPDDSACTTTTYLDNTWHHISAIKSGTSSIQLFVDGNLVAEDTSLAATNSLSGTTPTIAVGGGANSGTSSYTQQISATNRDGYQWTSWASNEIYVGEWDSTSETGAWHFSNVTVPQGSVITSATLTLEANGTYPGGSLDGLDLRILANDIDNASLPSGTNLPRSMAQTTATVSWDPTQWNDGVRYDLPNIATVIQEVVDRGGWTSGNAMNILVDNRGTTDQDDLYVADYSSGAGNAASLTINYETAGPGPAFNSWNGSIDEIKVFNYALNQEQLKANMSPGSSAGTAANIGGSDFFNGGAGSLSNGLVAHWTFDETSATNNCSTGTLLDSTSYGHHLASCPNGSGTTTTTAGQFGNSVVLDGSNDYLITSHTDELNPTNEWTIAGWFYNTSANYVFDKRGLISKGQTYAVDDYVPYSAYISFNTLFVGIEHNFSKYEVEADISSLSSSTWHHFAATYDSDTQSITIYVNGVLAAGPEALPQPAVGNTSDLYIGSQNGLNAFWQGRLDDFRVYNRVLSQNEITSLNTLNPAFSAHWKFDEGAGTTANNSDASGSTLNGTLSNFSSPATSTSGWTNNGKNGKALIFDGTDDIVNLGSAGTIDDMPALTFSAWIYPTGWGESNFGRIIAKENSATALGLTLVNDSGQSTFRLYRERATTAAQATAASGTLSLNTWHHVVGVLDISNSIIRLYHNGREVGSYIDQTLGSGTVTSDASLNLNIGNRTNTDRSFQGTIDDVRIFNQVLTAEQISSLYNQGQAVVGGKLSTTTDGITVGNSSANENCVPGDTSTCLSPVGSWRLDENTGTTANDNSGNNNTFTLVNTPTWNRGKFGSGVRLNGTSQYLRANPMAGLSTTAGSVSGWFYPTTTPAGDEMLIMGNRNPDRIYLFRLATTGNFAIRLGTMGANADTGISLPANTWSHVTLTWNSGTYVAYVNGRQAITGAYTGLSTLYNYLTVGAYDDSSTQNSYFTGTVDQVFAYSYARTPAQVAWEYNRGGQSLWYKLDECTGTTINDSSGRGVNGTLTIGGGGTTSAGTCTTSGAWFNGVSGKFNASIDLDGTDDYISVSSPNAPTGDFTYAFWTQLDATDDETLFQIANSSNQDELKLTHEGTLYIYSNNSSTNTGITLSTGQWTHLALSRSGSTITLYVNGKAGATRTDSTAFDFTSCQMLIGTDTDSGCAGSLGNWLNGRVDDFRVYPYALTQNQLNIILNGGAALRYGSSQ